MLENLKKENTISVLGAIFPEHLDRHWSMEKYTRSKLNILSWSKNNVVYKKTIQDYALLEKYPDLISYWDDGSIENIERSLLWQHNLENIRAALAVAHIVWISQEKALNAIKTFQWLPHRMQKISDKWWFVWIDDAISTTPQSTIEAIKTFGEDIDTIFLWGTDRGYDFEELITFIYKNNIHNIVLFPDTWNKIYSMIQNNTKEYTLNILKTNSMQDAVKFAFEVTEKWKIVLLSTASPSYSLWKNFEEKGDLFQKHILDFWS
jgi:UDP-N-acetylmuramoylalanine--D-glutamate ligase